jgi:hypothetical protein
VPHRRDETLALIGWREWLALPDLGAPRIKAKIDTGARSSALHAFGLQTFPRDGQTWVRFEIHPLQRSSEGVIPVEMPVFEFRRVRSSSGHVTRRPVIVTTVAAGDIRWPVELTLANRDAMGFRMLLGRQSLRNRFLVSPGRSYVLGGQSPRRQRRRIRGSEPPPFPESAS